MNSTPTISAVDFIRRCAETLAESHFEPGKTYWFCDQCGETHKFTIPPEPRKTNSSPPQKPPRPRRSSLPPF